MNILFSITYFDPYVSGLSLYVKRLAMALAREDHTITVLTMKHDASLPTRKSGRLTIVRAHPFIRIHKGFLSFDWWKQSWLLVQKAQVVIINLPQVEGVIPALLGKMQGKRVIAIYHCEVMLPSGFFYDVIQTGLELCNLASLLLADTIVTYTREYEKSSRLLRLVRKIKSHTVFKSIYPVIPMPRVRPSVVRLLQKKIFSARSNTSARTFVIGVAARLSTEKGIEYLLMALPRIQKLMKTKAITLAIAGPMTPVGEYEYKRRIMTLSKKYKKNVVFLGEISPSDMGSYYTCIDVLSVPSINSTESFGIVQVEAMLVGVPVVASDLVGVRVPIQKTGMGIVVPPKNAQKLATAIAQVLKRSYEKSYVDRVKRIFDEKKVIATWKRVLSQ